MNRRILVEGLIAIAFLFIGSCSENGDNCLQCPSHEPERPYPVKILIAAAEVESSRVDTIIDYSIEKDLLPEGSEIQVVSLIDSMPPLEELVKFDAVFLYTVALLEFPDENELIGNVMADYVDAGGGIVMCQWSMHDGAAGIAGRLRAPGYCPLKAGPIGNIAGDRVVEMSSISFPLHPIFYGIDVRNITSPGWYNIPHPALDESAILLAKDQFGANAIAINSTGNIIGLNIWPSYVFSSYDRHPNAAKLIANSLLFVAGSLQ